MARTPADTSNMIDQGQYNEICDKKKSELRRQKGWFRDIAGRIRRSTSSGIENEARGDWQRIRRSYDIILARKFENGHVSQEIAHKLATAHAYLELARDAEELSETWSYVNQASEILCPLATNAEKEAFEHRLATWEPILNQWLGELYDDKDTQANLKQTREKETDIRRKIVVYSQQWQYVNQWISFTRRFRRLALIVLAVTLVLAVSVAQVLYNKPTGSAQLTPNPFIWISVLGVFGGALSAMLTAKVGKITAVTYKQSKTEIFIRLVLGASGSFVIYVLINVPGVFDAQIVEFVNENLYGFLMLGIVAGFSERLFLSALKKAEKSLPSSGISQSKKANS